MNTQPAGAPRPEPPGPYERFSDSVRSVPWWINMVLGFLGAAIAPFFGWHLHLASWESAVAGFIIGSSFLWMLPIYIGIAFLAFCAKIGWDLLQHYDPLLRR